MAITKTNLNGDFTALKIFLESLNLFGSVVSNIASSTATVTCKDSDDNTLLIITGNNLSTSNASFTIRAYQDANHYKEKTYNTQAPRFVSGYACSNGGIIVFQPSNSTYVYAIAELLITKTNNNKVAFIFTQDQASSTSAATVIFTNFYSIAWGDDDYLSGVTSMNRNGVYQTMMLPFPTAARVGTPSYTPKAFYIPVGQYYSIGANGGVGIITIDGVDYLSNGTWAIKDEEDAS